MKWLLIGINAKYIHSNPAVYSLAAYAGEQSTADGESLSQSIEIAEYTINQHTDEILMDIYQRHPDIIAFSCYIWNIKIVEELIGELHAVCEDMPIWLGGPEVSFHAEQTMQKFPFLTGIMIGEGEKTFLELLRYYREGKSGKTFSDIRGIVTNEGTSPPQECMDLNEIPFLYRDLTGFENRIIYYESSRGCPFQCTYCLSSLEKKMRFRDIGTVKKELQFFLDKKTPQVKFIDRTFNAVSRHAIEIWQYIKEHDNGITNFHFEIAADLLTEEEILLLLSMRKGLVQLEIGVQSANPDTLAAVSRFTDLSRLKTAVERLAENKKIHRHLDLIAGLPYEDYASFRRSFCEVYSMHPEQIQLGFLKVLKGSRMECQKKNYGIVCKNNPPYEVLLTKWLSYEDIIRLKKIESMVELFYNSGQFMHTICFLESQYSDAFLMFEDLALFYDKKEYFKRTSKRMEQYERFFAFVLETFPDYKEVFRELLTLDAYLRENLKTRPSFAKDQTNDWKIIREFYQKEEEERTYLPAHKKYHAKQMEKMTHAERFSYPVWEIQQEKIIKPLKEERLILFDYMKMDPVTKSCRLVIV